MPIEESNRTLEAAGKVEYMGIDFQADALDR